MRFTQTKEQCATTVDMVRHHKIQCLRKAVFPRNSFAINVFAHASYFFWVKRFKSYEYVSQAAFG